MEISLDSPVIVVVGREVTNVDSEFRLDNLRATFRADGYTRLVRYFSLQQAMQLRVISDSMSDDAMSIIEKCAAERIPLATHAHNNRLELIVVAERLSPMQVCRY